MCVCAGFDMDVYPSRLSLPQLSSVWAAQPTRLLLPRVWWYSVWLSEMKTHCNFILKLYVVCMCVCVSECVLDGDKTRVPNGWKWTDKENECVTCVCNVSNTTQWRCFRNYFICLEFALKSGSLCHLCVSARPRRVRPAGVSFTRLCGWIGESEESWEVLLRVHRCRCRGLHHRHQHTVCIWGTSVQP